MTENDTAPKVAPMVDPLPDPMPDAAPKKKNFLFHRRGRFQLNPLEIASYLMALLVIVFSSGEFLIEMIMYGQGWRSNTWVLSNFVIMTVVFIFAVQYLRSTRPLYRVPVHVISALGYALIFVTAVIAPLVGKVGE